MVFTTPDLSDDYPEAKALSPILTNFGGRKSFFGPIETLQCPDDNSFVKKLLHIKFQKIITELHGSSPE